MRLLFALPGFHKYDRGAEVALLSVAGELARTGDDVTVIGSGPDRPDVPYRFVHAGSISRERFERFPNFPPLRSETVWEEASFMLPFLVAYRPGQYDATLTCSFPFTNMMLRRPTLGGPKPLHIFVTQNGDWPAMSDDSEYRLFRCDGLVCTNPDYAERNAERWPTATIPNGIDPDRYARGQRDRARFGIPEGRPVVLMVSAFIETKRVLDGIRAVALLPDAHLVVAGDGPLRAQGDALAAELMPGRFTRLTTSAAEMPHLYRSADAFLHMSLLESFGNVFVEAMASGLPIIAHDTPRLRWIVGDDEPLVDTQDIAATGAALRQALDAPPRDTVSARVDRFSWQSIARQYRAFIQGLIDARVPHG